jgi:hypothetical protein
MRFTPALRKLLALITLFSTCPLYGSNPLLEEGFSDKRSSILISPQTGKTSPSILEKIDSLIDFVQSIPVYSTINDRFEKEALKRLFAVHLTKFMPSNSTQVAGMSGGDTLKENSAIRYTLHHCIGSPVPEECHKIVIFGGGFASHIHSYPYALLEPLAALKKNVLGGQIHDLQTTTHAYGNHSIIIIPSHDKQKFDEKNPDFKGTLVTYDSAKEKSVDLVYKMIKNKGGWRTRFVDLTKEVSNAVDVYKVIHAEDEHVPHQKWENLFRQNGWYIGNHNLSSFHLNESLASELLQLKKEGKYLRKEAQFMRLCLTQEQEKILNDFPHQKEYLKDRNAQVNDLLPGFPLKQEFKPFITNIYRSPSFFKDFKKHTSQTISRYFEYSQRSNYPEFRMIVTLSHLKDATLQDLKTNLISQYLMEDFSKSWTDVPKRLLPSAVEFYLLDGYSKEFESGLFYLAHHSSWKDDFTTFFKTAFIIPTVQKLAELQQTTTEEMLSKIQSIKPLNSNPITLEEIIKMHPQLKEETFTKQPTSLENAYRQHIENRKRAMQEMVNTDLFKQMLLYETFASQSKQ